ncbi:xre family transcriptional regulator [Leptolyngbya sp. Heron Island J]|uniref:helix-turn-helix domain-containing protein n=1 Tax=Leptolyngbya sp. Heron Island J TaxID=1385935 RepID=UPI0003B9A334|nr:xre family transcriptional regulator [Leptolyngbya sp. Heron Island J]
MMKHVKKGSITQTTRNSARAGHSQAALDLRTELGHELRKILIKKRLKQRELATLLAIRQPEVSHLFNGNFTRFTIDRLVQFFNRLGWMVKFQIYPHDCD